MRAVCESFQMSKDAGFKVVSHMMPDLPNVDLERDIEQFIVSLAQLQVWLSLNSDLKLNVGYLVEYLCMIVNEGL